MTGQPHRRQVRFLIACALFTAFVAAGSLFLIRVNCDRLASSTSLVASARQIARIEYFSALILLSGCAGIASLAAAGQIILRRYALETDALRRLHKHTVRKANRMIGKQSGLVMPAKPASRDSGQPDRVLQTAMTAEIARMTGRLRELAARGPGADTDARAAEIDVRVRHLETAAAGVNQLLVKLRSTAQAEAGAPHRLRTPDLAPKPEQLRKLAAAIDSAGGSGASRSATTSHADLAVI